MASSNDPKSLIREYKRQNSSHGGPALKTPDGSYLNGFYIDRKSIQELLDSNAEITGISIHLAKDPSATGKPDNIFTIFYSGAIGHKPPFKSAGKLCGPPPPCPPWCVEL